ncbi:MAG: NYN domain-containing protein [Candidatus Kerfeldbacteria bacterium]|nr:NYN domain-containing protein [Candidatus Kerfeldbacteria bacterium]
MVFQHHYSGHNNNCNIFIMHQQKEGSTKVNVIYIFIDFSNLWAAQKVRGKFLDYTKLTNYIKSMYEATSMQVFFYTAYPAEGTRSYNLDGKHKFFTYLEKGLKFVVRKKELKRISVITEQGESIEEKGNMDVEITIDAVHYSPKYNTAIFFTGDSDFLALITYLRTLGKKVYIFSSKNNVSQELRTGSNGYLDVLVIKEDIWGRNIKRRIEQV